MNSGNRMNGAETIALLDIHSRRARAQVAKERRTLHRPDEQYENPSANSLTSSAATCGSSEKDHTGSYIVIREPAPMPQAGRDDLVL